MERVLNVFSKMLSKTFFFPNSHVQKYLQDLIYSKDEPSFWRVHQIGGPKDLAHELKGLNGNGKAIFFIYISTDGFNLL